MQAIAQVFPTAETHLCTFHREQAWLRWTKDGKNCLADREQGELLHLLRSIAWARTEESCLVAIENLRESRIYQDSEKVRTYVEQWWISIKEHIFAIFSNTKHSWDSLPLIYTLSPYLTLDTFDDVRGVDGSRGAQSLEDGEAQSLEDGEAQSLEDGEAQSLMQVGSRGAESTEDGTESLVHDEGAESLEDGVGCRVHDEGAVSLKDIMPQRIKSAQLKLREELKMFRLGPLPASSNTEGAPGLLTDRQVSHASLMGNTSNTQGLHLRLASSNTEGAPGLLTDRQALMLPSWATQATPGSRSLLNRTCTEGSAQPHCFTMSCDCPVNESGVRSRMAYCEVLRGVSGFSRWRPTKYILNHYGKHPVTDSYASGGLSMRWVHRGVSHTPHHYHTSPSCGDPHPRASPISGNTHTGGHLTGGPPTAG
ncbi:unnamed protein product [Leuciscus chuanchicus]